LVLKRYTNKREREKGKMVSKSIFGREARAAALVYVHVDEYSQDGDQAMPSRCILDHTERKGHQEGRDDLYKIALVGRVVGNGLQELKTCVGVGHLAVAAAAARWPSHALLSESEKIRQDGVWRVILLQCALERSSVHFDEPSQRLNRHSRSVNSCAGWPLVGYSLVFDQLSRPFHLVR
jgi:hypothetical protein